MGLLGHTNTIHHPFGPTSTLEGRTKIPEEPTTSSIGHEHPESAKVTPFSTSLDFFFMVT